MRYTKDFARDDPSGQTPLEILQDRVIVLLQRAKEVNYISCGFSYEHDDRARIDELLSWLSGLNYQCLHEQDHQYVRVILSYESLYARTS